MNTKTKTKYRSASKNKKYFNVNILTVKQFKLPFFVKIFSKSFLHSAVSLVLCFHLLLIRRVHVFTRSCCS